MAIENAIYVLVIDGRYWQIQEDGTLLELPQNQIPDTAIVIDSLAASQVQQFLAQNADSSPSSFINVATFFASIQRVGPERLPLSGFDTRQTDDGVERLTQAEAQGEDTEPLPLDPNAEIQVTIDDNGDGYINMFEVPKVDIIGQTEKLFDGQLIEVVITDSANKFITLMTSVSQNQFNLKGVDLSTLAQGDLQVTATASDFYGTSISASDDSIIDTLAIINNDFIFDGGTLLNAIEIQSVDIDGSTAEINPGQSITLVFEDTQGSQLSATTTIAADGRYQLKNIDLSTLADGDITVTATSTDIPGNIAERQTVIVKDTQASIDVQFDGAPPYGATELNTVTLSGTVQNVEAGNVVTVIVTDGTHTDTLQATVKADGSWQTEIIDLSGYNDGGLSATASVSDIAGNPASNSTNTSIDTVVVIDIDTSPNGLNIDDIRAGNTVTVKGTTDAESGQTVTVKLTDHFSNEQTFSAVVQPNGSWSTAVTVTILDATSAWNLIAEVSDVAGNKATDETPSIELPTPAVLSEDALVTLPAGYSQNSTIRITGYDDIEFSSVQTALSSVTSLSEVLTVSIINAGQELVLERPSDSQQVLGAVINPDGTITVTIYAPVDQPPLSDSVFSGITIEATQNDADSTTETVVANVPIEIRESLGFTVDDSATVRELELVSGNLFDNDNLLEGPLNIVSIKVDGTIHPVLSATPTVVATSKGELTVNSDGSWSLLAIGNLDNTVLQTLDFTYSALDQDKDFSTANVTITINDGASGNFPSTDKSQIEKDYDDSSTSSINFVVDAGSDDLDPATIKFSPSQLEVLDGLGYESTGNAITYALTNGGKNLVASEGGSTVFELLLSATVDGSGNLNATVTYTQLLPVDHVTTESIVFPLVAEALDIDGTAIASHSTLFVVDGNNPSSTADAGAVNEDDIPTTAAATGNIQVNIGSDQITGIAFTTDQQPAITSGGDTISYRVSPDGLTLTGYTSSTDPVFTAVMSGAPNATTDTTLTYTFTLHEGLDQLDSSGNRLDPLNLDLRYKLTDFDGDESYASIPIDVSDASGATGGDVTLQLTETPRALTHLLTPNAASVDFSLTATQDAITSASFNLSEGMGVVDSAGDPVTQNDQPLKWHEVNSYTWQARTPSGVTVIELTLPDNINIGSGAAGNVPLSVAVLSELDQGSKGSPANNITLPVTIDFADSGGTTTSLKADISVFDGRNPVAISATDLTVDENNLLTGSTSDSGTAAAFTGSDDLKEVLLTLNTPLFTGPAGTDAVSLATSATSEGWWIATDTGGDEVFRVRVDLTGETEFILSKPLDHPDGAGQNNLAIDFGAQVMDADGDTSNTITLTVNVTDDVPVTVDSSLKLTEGSTKTINVLADGKEGADGASLTKVSYDPGTGVDHYTFTVNPIDIDLYEAGVQYGTATIYKNGVIEVSTVDTLSADFIDDLVFEVTDTDNDIVTNTLNLTIKDEAANIEISPLVTDEDTPLTLTLTADPGDIDKNEVVTAITFDSAALQQGVLTLDGSPLATDGSGNPILSIANGTLQVIDPVTQQVGPNGALVFTPFLNSSDPTSNVAFNVTVAIDTSDGPRIYADSFDVSVNPIVDLPIWDTVTSNFTYTMNEDGTPPSLAIKADLFDTDGSETLSYRVENIEAGLNLSSNGNVINDGDVLTASEMANLAINVTPNYAGQLQFDAVAIATETSTGDSAEIGQTITVDVAPVADVPSLSTSNVFMYEDQLVDLSTFIDGRLNDQHGSESLHYELTLPTGWMVTDSSGAETGLISSGVYRVSDAEVQGNLVFLKPLQDISSESGNFSLTVAAVAIESTADGIQPAVPEALSPPRTVAVEVKGVNDSPTVAPGPDNAWSFDGTNITGQFDEDNLIPLNFVTGTEDDDASEVFSFVISDLPDGVRLVYADGSLAQLAVLGEFNGKPEYSVSASELANLFIKPVSDYSGQILFGLQQINTEPDGDSTKFDLVVDITVNPVVDTANGISSTSVGVEDTAIVLDLRPDIADIDGSETLTNIIMQAPPGGAVILLDGVPVSFSGGTLDIAQLASDNGTDFNTLISSERLTLRPPEDSDVNISVSVSFEITDTSGLGATTIKRVDGTLEVDVKAIVDDTIADGITNITTPSATLVSSDGSAIDLSTAATFNEADIDGSEYLDYITISAPESDGWFITHPNGAIHDGLGNWLIPAIGLTSDSVVETAQALLAGATIVSDHITNPVAEVVIAARVLDHNDDADIIQSTIKVDFQVAGSVGSAQAIDILQTSIIGGLEAQTANTSGHIDTLADGDANDVVSFRVDVADMPHGGAITGADVITQYAADGSTVIAYVFTNASFGNLAIVGMDEDFAGATSIEVNKISTDPLGDTVVTTESLDIELQPVVDSIDSVDTIEMSEDVPTRLNIDLDSLLNDSSTIASEGLESVTSVKFLAVSEGSIWGAPGLLVDSGGGTLTLNDPSRIGEVFYIPPAHKHGSTSVDIELTVQDQTTGITLGSLSDTVIQTFTTTLNFDIVAVTDPVFVVTSTIQGDEDSDIALSGLNVIDVDTDGSETLSMQLIGVPADALLFYDNGSTLQLLNNDGPDGSGGFIWNFDPSQITDLVLRPPRDFAGDITLTLQSTSMETSTQEILTNAQSFTLEVSPIADGAEFTQGLEDVTVTEGSNIEIVVNADTLEAINPNETITLLVFISNSSDGSATVGLSGIKTPDGKTGTFISNGSGFIASINTTLNELPSLEILAGESAFGTLDVTIYVGSTDSAVVGGVLEKDTTNIVDMPSQSLTVEITPLPTVPELSLTAESVLIGDGLVPLGLSLNQVNPAPGETSDIVISGLPPGITLSAGNLTGAQWIVEQADIASLSITNGVAGETYTLGIEPRSSLNGETVSGSQQSVTVEVQTNGNNALTGGIGRDWLIGKEGADTLVGGKNDDTLTGGTEQDLFQFSVADLGSAATPANDVITDFTLSDNDQIDLTDIITINNTTTGTDLSADISLTEDAGTTTLALDLGSGNVQNIALSNVTKDDLYGGDSSSATDAQILQNMIDNNLFIER